MLDYGDALVRLIKLHPDVDLLIVLWTREDIVPSISVKLIAAIYDKEVSQVVFDLSEKMDEARDQSPD